MPAVPKKVHERIVAGIKQFQPILASTKSHDMYKTNSVAIIESLKSSNFFYFLKDEIGHMRHITAFNDLNLTNYYAFDEII